MDPARPTSAFDDSEFDDPDFDRRFDGPLTDEERFLAIGAHLSPLVGFGLIAPFVIYLLKRDQSAFVADQAKEALNFHLTMLLAAVVSGVLVVVLIGLPMLLAVGLATVVLGVVAAIKANDGERYRYPFTVRLIK